MIWSEMTPEELWALLAENEEGIRRLQSEVQRLNSKVQLQLKVASRIRRKALEEAARAVCTDCEYDIPATWDKESRRWASKTTAGTTQSVSRSASPTEMKR